MRVKNLMLFIHRGQKSLKTQYEINIFASKFHLGLLGVLLGVLGRLGLILGFNTASRWASWAHLGLQYRLKMAQVALHRATKFAQRVFWGASWALLGRLGAP